MKVHICNKKICLQTKKWSVTTLCPHMANSNLKVFAICYASASLWPLLNCTYSVTVLKHSVQGELVCCLREKSVNHFVRKDCYNFPTRTFGTQTLCRVPSLLAMCSLGQETYLLGFFPLWSWGHGELSLFFRWYSYNILLFWLFFFTCSPYIQLSKTACCLCYVHRLQDQTFSFKGWQNPVWVLYKSQNCSSSWSKKVHL